MTGRLGLALLALSAGAARGDGWSSAEILGSPRAFTIESVRLRFTEVQQQGLGFQSQAGPVAGPGSEELYVAQPQLEVVARQGERLTHRLWIPLDVVTAASPDALDAVSSASRTNEAGSFDLTSSYRADRATETSLRAGFHIEEPFRSWNLGVGVARSLADDNALLTASVQQIYDWFDAFTVQGVRIGHANRSTTNLSLGLTQLLSPTTVAHVDYGGTVQLGVLGNTWNSVPLASGERGDERLPSLRHRHALVARIAQALPWRGALHALYRFYADDWGIVAHTAEVELYQRLGRAAYVRLGYRFYQQEAASFFSTRAAPEAALRTADSDLESFVAQTFGAKVAIDLALGRRLRAAHLDVGYDRYLRSNRLHASIFTCSLGFRF